LPFAPLIADQVCLLLEDSLLASFAGNLWQHTGLNQIMVEGIRILDVSFLCAKQSSALLAG